MTTPTRQNSLLTQAQLGQKTNLSSADMNGQGWYASDDMDLVLAAQAHELGFKRSEHNAQVWTHEDGRVLGLPTSGGVNRVHEDVVKEVIEAIHLEWALAKSKSPSTKPEATVLLAHNVGGHWTLGELDIKADQKGTHVQPLFYDPAQAPSSSEAAEKHLQHLRMFEEQISLAVRAALGQDVDIQPGKEIATKHKQQDASSCGPVVCEYAQLRMRGLPLTKDGTSFEPGARGLRLLQFQAARKLPDVTPEALYSLYSTGDRTKLRDALLLRLKLELYQERFQPNPPVTLNPEQEKALGITGNQVTQHDAWLAVQVQEIQDTLAIGTVGQPTRNPALTQLTSEAVAQELKTSGLKPNAFNQPQTQALSHLIEMGLTTAERREKGHYAVPLNCHQQQKQRQPSRKTADRPLGLAS